MLRPIFVACALIASATCAARPMVIHPVANTGAACGLGLLLLRLPRLPSMAIGPSSRRDHWSSTPVEPTADLATPCCITASMVNGHSIAPWCVASREYDHLVRIGGHEQWRRRDRLQPDAHLQAHEQHLGGDRTSVHGAAQAILITSAGALVWDGNTLLARTASTIQLPWGALISRLNADGSWSPLERLSSGDTACSHEPAACGPSRAYRGRGHLHQ